MPKAVVIEVVESFTQKGNYYLNKINFDNQTMAFEKFVAGHPSKFIVGKCVEYNITHPGYEGKPDWIEWTGNCDDDVVSKEETGRALLLNVLQNALTNATNLHIAIANQSVGVNDLGPLEVLETTKILALGVINIAQEISSSQNKQ